MKDFLEVSKISKGTSSKRLSKASPEIFEHSQELSVLDVFEFNSQDFKDKELNVILSTLSKEEKKVFNLLKLSDDALTATQIYDYYIDKLIREDKSLQQKMEELNKQMGLRKGKKPLEVKAEFARKNNVKVPTNRTVTRVLDGLKDAGFVVRRNADNKKVKAYYCLVPKLKMILEHNDGDIKKKRELEEVRSKVEKLKSMIEGNK